MKATRLCSRAVPKPWGRRDLPPHFGQAGDEPVGEVWFEDPRQRPSAELLIKYLFTSDKLSVQVHPDDAAAHARGLRAGKDEAWLVLEADPGATIGIGLKAKIDKARLCASARDGSIEQLLDWRPVAAGDFYYSPGGTVHAIGPGLKLIEIQQYADLTYRLYDYGRPRELHVEEGVAVARAEPYLPIATPRQLDAGRTVLAHGAKFVVEFWAGPVSRLVQGTSQSPAWVVPIAGTSFIEEEPVSPGTVWLVEAESRLTLAGDAELLVAYPGAEAWAVPV